MNYTKEAANSNLYVGGRKEKRESKNLHLRGTEVEQPKKFYAKNQGTSAEGYACVAFLN